MAEGNSKKLEDVRDKVNNSLEKATELREDVDNFREEIEDDLRDQEVGEYFAAEGGYNEFTEIQEELEELKDEIKGKLGLAAYAEPEQAEELLLITSDTPESDVRETAEELTRVGDLYDNARRTFQNTVKAYVAGLEDENTEIYGGLDSDELLPTGEQLYQDGKKIHMPDAQNFAATRKLALIGEKLDGRESGKYDMAKSKAAADD